MELDDGEASAADHLDFVHARHTASEDCCYEVQDLCRGGGGQVDVRQDGVLGAAVI